jgi:hypothetical protein
MSLLLTLALPLSGVAGFGQAEGELFHDCMEFRL